MAEGVWGWQGDRALLGAQVWAGHRAQRRAGSSTCCPWPRRPRSHPRCCHHAALVPLFQAPFPPPPQGTATPCPACGTAPMAPQHQARAQHWMPTVACLAHSAPISPSLSPHHTQSPRTVPPAHSQWLHQCPSKLREALPLCPPARATVSPGLVAPGPLLVFQAAAAAWWHSQHQPAVAVLPRWPEAPARQQGRNAASAPREPPAAHQGPPPSPRRSPPARPPRQAVAAAPLPGTQSGATIRGARSPPSPAGCRGGPRPRGQL